ncbi:MAG TPA: LytTR family transcriptional regulator DNA-binding domain-containing protein [Bacteroidales bacterium]|nr:LytTR family transcriptional regulator DNA-binding domain-containing protein [Bacteroidales bacterium]
MNKVTTIIIDDEKPARDLIRIFLTEFPQIELIAECIDGFEGIKAIGQYKPDLVFLDIQMPRLNGFEMLELLDDEEFPVVIFTTAYDQYAIKAFDHNAIDYLLKPISANRFKQSVEKALQILKVQKESGGRRKKTIETTALPGKYLERVVLRTSQGLQIIPEHLILYVEAADDYVKICTANDTFLKKKTLKYFEENLDPDFFVKVHRSYLIRIDAIRKIEPYSKDAFIAKLKNGQKVSVSKSGYANLKQFFR